MSIEFNKRSGSELFNEAKYEANIHALVKQHAIDIDVKQFVQDVIKSLPSNFTYKELVSAGMYIAYGKVIDDPFYEDLSVVLYVNNMHKETLNTFSEKVKLIQDTMGVLDPELVKFTLDNADAIDAIIDYGRDFKFTFLGVNTLDKQNYSIKDIDNRLIERPQDVYMRYAVTIGYYLNKRKCTGSSAALLDVAEIYDLVSLKYFTPASPGLFNSMMSNLQLNSCFLFECGDSTEGIMDAARIVAQVSRRSGGIGMHIHSIRPGGSYINGTRGKTGSIITLLGMFDKEIAVFKQNDKRRGALSIWYEVWNRELYSLLEAKKTQGSEDLRTRNLFFGCLINNVFMQRVTEGGTWTLFSPIDVPKLANSFGKRFQEYYEEYERTVPSANTIVLDAREVFTEISKTIATHSGTYVCNKDEMNLKNNQVEDDDEDPIKSSNLCCEINEKGNINPLTGKTDVAACNLSSLILSNFVVNGEFDYKKLHSVVYKLTEILNLIIYINKYPVEECNHIKDKYAPIGIGIQDLAGVFIKKRIPFIGSKAEHIDKCIMETIYHAALLSSHDIAMREGSYGAFDKSKFAKGTLQFDMWDYTPTKMYDWEPIREKVKKGMANSLLTALAPTESTSQIAGAHPAFEPIKGIIQTKKTGHGKYHIICREFVEDMKACGIWNDKLKSLLIQHRGMVDDIHMIPLEYRRIYKSVWSMRQSDLIARNAIRSACVDQSTSFNLFTKEPSVGLVKKILLLGWKHGLKTDNFKNVEKVEDFFFVF